MAVNTAAVFIAWYACSEALAVEFHAFGVAAVADFFLHAFLEA